MISKVLASLKAKILFLVSLILLVGLTFVVSYFLNKAISFKDTEYFGNFFWAVRFIVAGLMILSGVYFVVSRKDVSGKLYFLVATAILQILPLIIRFIGLIDNETVAIEVSIIPIAIMGVAYLIFSFYLLIVTDQIQIARKATKAKVTKASDEEEYYDKDGNFVGKSK